MNSWKITIWSLGLGFQVVKVTPVNSSVKTAKTVSKGENKSLKKINASTWKQVKTPRKMQPYRQALYGHCRAECRYLGAVHMREELACTFNINTNTTRCRRLKLILHLHHIFVYYTVGRMQLYTSNIIIITYHITSCKWLTGSAWKTGSKWNEYW